MRRREFIQLSVAVVGTMSTSCARTTDIGGSPIPPENVNMSTNAQRVVLDYRSNQTWPVVQILGESWGE